MNKIQINKRKVIFYLVEEASELVTKCYPTENNN